MHTYDRPYRRPRSGISDQLPIRLDNRAFLGDIGFPVDHPYVEEIWAPLIGSPAARTYQRLAETIGQEPFGRQVIDIASFAASIGVDTTSAPADALFEILCQLASYDLGYFVRRTVRKVPTTVFHVTGTILAAPARAVAAHSTALLERHRLHLRQLEWGQ